jgi:hypothetical protein
LFIAVPLFVIFATWSGIIHSPSVSSTSRVMLHSKAADRTTLQTQPVFFGIAFWEKCRQVKSLVPRSSSAVK